MSREVVKVGAANDIHPSLDPFLYFRYRPRTTDFKGFTDHPHRYDFFENPLFFITWFSQLLKSKSGFETVTHVLEGGILHEDFAGNKGGTYSLS